MRPPRLSTGARRASGREGTVGRAWRSGGHGDVGDPMPWPRSSFAAHLVFRRPAVCGSVTLPLCSYLSPLPSPPTPPPTPEAAHASATRIHRLLAQDGPVTGWAGYVLFHFFISTSSSCSIRLSSDRLNPYPRPPPSPSFDIVTFSRPTCTSAPACTWLTTRPSGCERIALRRPQALCRSLSLYPAPTHCPLPARCSRRAPRVPDTSPALPLPPTPDRPLR